MVFLRYLPLKMQVRSYRCRSILPALSLFQSVLFSTFYDNKIISNLFILKAQHVQIQKQLPGEVDVKIPATPAVLLIGRAKCQNYDYQYMHIFEDGG